MKPEAQDSTPFIKQIGKLFEELSAKQQTKPKESISPRITCTRLRRLREMKRELVLDTEMDFANSPSQQDSISSEQSTVAKRNENFADWVLRNQQAHQQFIDKQNQYREQLFNNSRDNKEANKTICGFANFSPSALQVVAKNPNTPMSTLKWLAAHYRVEVRQSVALNENIDIEILDVLSRDGEDIVRTSVLDNAKLSHDLLVRLCDDNSPLVAEKAKNILYEKTKHLLKSGQNPILVPSVKVEIAQQAKTEKINDQESKLIEREFLAVIAERSTTPARRLAELAMHPDSTIRSLVATNPNITPEIFWRLAKDPLPEVRIKLLGNYNCPKDVIEYVKR